MLLEKLLLNVPLGYAGYDSSLLEMSGSNCALEINNAKNKMGLGEETQNLEPRHPSTPKHEEGTSFLSTSKAGCQGLSALSKREIPWNYFSVFTSARSWLHPVPIPHAPLGNILLCWILMSDQIQQGYKIFFLYLVSFFISWSEISFEILFCTDCLIKRRSERRNAKSCFHVIFRWVMCLDSLASHF